MKIADTLKRHTHLALSSWQQRLVCSSDLSHFATHIHQQPLVLLRVYRCKTTREREPPPSQRRVIDPSRSSFSSGLGGFGCSLWVVGFCGSGIWPCLVISLHLSFLSLLSLCSNIAPTLFLTNTPTAPHYPPPPPFLLPSLPPFLQVTDLRMEITRGFTSTLRAHKLTCFLFTYNLIFVHWCFLQSVDTMLTVCVILVYKLVVKP